MLPRTLRASIVVVVALSTLFVGMLVPSAGVQWPGTSVRAAPCPGHDHDHGHDDGSGRLAGQSEGEDEDDEDDRDPLLALDSSAAVRADGHLPSAGPPERLPRGSDSPLTTLVRGPPAAR